ncbi:MAG: hypothetical protein JXB04_07270 [Kiritimatiellae bacterium]|nr:hypothetical protein [Kiritimatiellia bacterium]
MARKFRVTVFGKAGCEKCKVLTHRLDAMLTQDEWADFERAYADLDTEDGLLDFCKAECINPQRVPAFIVSRLNPDTGGYDLLPNPSPGARDVEGSSARLYHLLGLQTDYSERGKGVISPRMIRAVFEEARAQ